MAAFAYLVACVFPFWAIPIAFLFLEQGNRKRLMGKRYAMWLNFFWSFLLILLSVLFFYFGLHKNIRPALKVFREGNIRTLW